MQAFSFLEICKRTVSRQSICRISQVAATEDGRIDGPERLLVTKHVWDTQRKDIASVERG